MGVLSILGSLSVITKFIPIVVAGVEKLFPNSKGSEKLPEVISILRLIFPQYFKDLPPELLNQFLEGLTETISGTVKIYNAVGVFKQSKDS
jgi:hypothetical protein